MNRSDHKILVGTAKGLLVYSVPGNTSPFIESTHFIGFSVNMVFIDRRNSRWWVGISHRHWGQKLHYTDDLGKTWEERKVPSYDGAELEEGKIAKLRQIWSMAGGGSDRPDDLWLGTDPGGLFHSSDNGESFQLVKSLWNHPSRKQKRQWFGAGSDQPFIHSIQVNPTDSDHLFIAVSSAGVFETIDGGNTWEPRNNGLVATYLPNPKVEVGHDPHRLLMSKSDPNILWQQNHCGVFFSDDGGKEWKDVSGKDGIPYYGFAITMDSELPSNAYVIPVQSDEKRIAPDLKLRVYETNDFGQSWQNVSDGLPVKESFDIVLRQSFDRKNSLMAFGTTSGNLYYSRDTNVYWELISQNLTKVNIIAIL